MRKSRVASVFIFLCVILTLLSACNTGTPSDDPKSSPTPGVSESPTASSKPTPEPTPETTLVEGPLNRLHQQGEYFSPILGLCEDYPKGTRVETIERDFALMAEYGIKDLRVSIAWGDYEKFKGHENWTLLDAKVDLAEKYGIELYPYICYSPGWATGGDWRTPPKDLDDWYDFVYRVVERYKGRINHWELWNEGDNYDFWSGTWQEQLELVKVGAKAVKDANPEAMTIFGGLTNKAPGHVNTIFTSGTAQYIDVINVHFYNGTWDPKPIETIYGTLKLIGDVIRRHGGKQELWVAEIGYSDYVQEDGKTVSAWVRKNFPYEKTRHFQAVAFYRAFSQIVATEDVSNILWYEIKNLRLDSAAIGDVNNYFLGALDHDRFPKHLWFAIASAKKLFADPYKKINDELAIEHDREEPPLVYGFRRENGDVVLVAWIRGLGKDTVKIEVPGSYRKALKYSVTGEKTPLEFAENETGVTMSLELDPADIHIIELIADTAPARLTLTDVKAEKGTDGAYNVRAAAVNIGGEKAKNITAEIVVSKSLEVSQSAIKEISELKPGEKTMLSWEIRLADPAGQEGTPQLWVVVRDGQSPPAATLVELDQN